MAYCKLALLLFAIKTVVVSSTTVFKCDFEADMCGFVRNSWESTSGITWIRHKGRAPHSPYKCCPQRDHTTGSGYYMIFSTRQSSTYGTEAEVDKYITIPNKQNIWIRFYYFMYEYSGYKSMGILQLKVGSNALFTKSGTQGNAWKRAEVKLTISGNKKFTFRATKYKNPYGDIAVDDIIIAEYIKANETKLTATTTSVCEDDYIELECNIYHGFPEAYVNKFYRDGVEFQRGNNAPKTFRLKSNVPGNNTFKCSPSNTLGSLPNDTIVITTNARPTVDNLPSSVIIIEGKTLHLVCNGTGNGPFNYTWTMQSTVYHSRNLTIENVQYNAHNNKIIKCEVKDKNGCTRTTNEARIKVHYPPKAPPHISYYALTCNTGKMYFSCYVLAEPYAKTYTFLIDGKKFRTSKDRRIYENLNLSPGLYNISCYGTNYLGSGQVGTRVVKVMGPANITSLSANQTVIEGSMTTIWCNSTGTEPLKYNWFREGSSQVIGTNSSLVFERVSREDIGAYKCKVWNDGPCPRMTSKYTNLYVIYKPENTTLTMTNTSLCLNDGVTFECRTKADPPVTEYILHMNGQPLETFNSNIMKINSTVAGNNSFTCQPKNAAGKGQNATVFVNTKAHPVITTITPSHSKHEGQNTVLWCNVTGSDPMEIIWTKLSTGAVVGNKPDLVFDNLTRDKEGEYSCYVSNGYECPSMNKTTDLDVQYLPENTTLTMTNTSLCLNDDVTFECRTKADPPVTEYILHMNGQPLENFNSSIMKINSTVAGNNSFTCQPKNVVGLGQNATVFINTKAPTVITGITPSFSQHEDRETVLKCNVTGSEPVKVLWTKTGSRGEIVGKKPELVLSKIKKEQEGEYKCTVSNGHECPIVNRTTEIDVKWSPKITKSPEKSVTLEEKGSVRFECKAIGDPKPNITWSRDNKVLGNADALKLIDTESEPGEYTCRAYNGVGSDAEFTVSVAVNVCNRKECKNKATCVRSGTTFKCNCKEGFWKRTCDTVDKRSDRYELQFIIVAVFTEDLNDRLSLAFIALENSLCDGIIGIYGARKILSCILANVRRGSIITQLDIRFNGTQRESEVMGTLISATVNGSLGNLTLKDYANGFNYTAIIENEKCAETPCKNEGTCIAEGDGYRCECKLFRHGSNCEKGIGLAAGIVLIIFSICLVVMVIFALIYFCCSKSSKKSYLAENGGNYKHDMNMGSFKYHNEGYAASKENLRTIKDNYLNSENNYENPNANYAKVKDNYANTQDNYAKNEEHNYDNIKGNYGNPDDDYESIEDNYITIENNYDTPTAREQNTT